MELTPYNTFTTELFLLCKNLYWDVRNGSFLTKPLTFLQVFADILSSKWNHHSHNKKKPTKTESTVRQQSSVSLQIVVNHDHNHNLGVEEIKMVMNKLGLDYSEYTSNDGIGGNDIVSIFDKEEPSFDEIKEVFDVFDENRDGFIDVVELQGVLCKFGQHEESGVEDCRKMISRFDENGDGVIDFKEFIRLMEKSFC